MNRPDREQNLGSERGVVLYVVALMMVVFLGVAAMAIDYGIWFTARAEAELFAERNPVRGVVPDVFPDQDIDVILDSQKVRVRVQRSDARGTHSAPYSRGPWGSIRWTSERRPLPRRGRGLRPIAFCRSRYPISGKYQIRGVDTATRRSATITIMIGGTTTSLLLIPWAVTGPVMEWTKSAG